MNETVHYVIYLHIYLYMNKLDTHKIAIDFAKKKGFDKCSEYGTIGKSFIYIAEYISDEILFIGYPTFIVVSGNNPRFATNEEVLIIMQIPAIEDKNFSEPL